MYFLWVLLDYEYYVFLITLTTMSKGYHLPNRVSNLLTAANYDFYNITLDVSRLMFSRVNSESLY